MKRIILIIAVMLISSIKLIAQTEKTNNLIERKSIGLQLTNSSIFVGFKAVTSKKLSVKFDFGIATLNEDFCYDDYMIDLKIHYSLRKSEKSNLYIGPFAGFEFVNDPTFNLITPYAGALAGYEYYFGKKKRSEISIEIGYIHGKKDYKKTYSADWGRVEYIGTFNNNPLILGIGYSYYL